MTTDSQVNIAQRTVWAAAASYGCSVAKVREVENAYASVYGIDAVIDADRVWADLKEQKLIPADATWQDKKPISQEQAMQLTEASNTEVAGGL